MRKGKLWTKRQIDLVSSFAVGVLSKKQMKLLVDHQIVRETSGEPGGSALDLTLAAGECWKLRRGVVKPHQREAFAGVLGNDQLASHESFTGPLRIEPKETFVFRIGQKLVLDTPLYAHATGKSSVGRLDVLARLIADQQPKYDQIDPPFDGDIYVELTPLTFPLLVRAGDPVCQLRFFKGHPSKSRLKGPKLRLYCTPILGTPRPEQLRVSIEVDPTVNAAAFVARTDVQFEPIPLGEPKFLLPPEDYWERVRPEGHGISIEKNRFYILRSLERFRLPSDLAVYAEAMHESLGEMRIHYAGFVHPHFGAGRPEGTPLIFEVRGHDVKVLLRQGEVLAKLQYFHMSEPAPDKTPAYEEQELKLSVKHFAQWKKAAR